MSRIIKTVLATASVFVIAACTNAPSQQSSNTTQEIFMTSNTEKVVELLNSFNTGDTAPVAYINPDKYIQHNLDVADGLAGFGAVLQNAPPQGFSAKVHRAFADGDYVVAHTEYDFF